MPNSLNKPINFNDIFSEMFGGDNSKSKDNPKETIIIVKAKKLMIIFVLNIVIN